MGVLALKKISQCKSMGKSFWASVYQVTVLFLCCVEDVKVQLKHVNVGSILDILKWKSIEYMCKAGLYAQIYKEVQRSEIVL